MLIERNYTLAEFLKWTRRSIYVLAIVCVVPVVLYAVFDMRWLVIPFSVVFLLGTTVALSAGFKNLQTYNRLQDAQSIWATITSSSRVFGMTCRDTIADPAIARAFVDRHLAWLATLRHAMRQRKPWETAEKAYNVEYNRKFTVPEREQSLMSELEHYLPEGDAANVLESRNHAYAVMALQSAEARRLLAAGAITASAHAELSRAFREFMGLQGRSKRIKNFPYPRQHAFIHTVFVRILCMLLPFGMIGEFQRLDDAVQGPVSMVWLAIPLSLVVSWMYIALDQVGEATENPFEGGANDVPITHLCEDIELDLREMLGESRLPSPTGRPGGIAL